MIAQFGNKTKGEMGGVVQAEGTAEAKALRFFIVCPSPWLSSAPHSLCVLTQRREGVHVYLPPTALGPKLPKDRPGIAWSIITTFVI